MFLFLLLAFMVAGAWLLTSWTQFAFRALDWVLGTGRWSVVPAGDQPARRPGDPAWWGWSHENARMMRLNGLTSWSTELHGATVLLAVVQCPVCHMADWLARLRSERPGDVHRWLPSLAR